MTSNQPQDRPGLVGRIFAALFKKGTGPSMRQIDSNYFVAGQISPDHLVQLKEAGFSAVCCMRPDGEAFGQPPFSDIETAAKALGINAYYLPVAGGSMPLQHAAKLRAVLREETGKILGYCASGGRSTMLYQLAGQAAA